MSYKKIAVRGGHTPTCCGASGIIDEVTEDRKVATALISVLKNAGLEVLDVTPPDDYNTVSKEIVYGVAMANNWGADLMISCHFNNAYDYTVDTAIGSEVVVKNYNTLGAAVGKAFESLGFKLRNSDSSGQLISSRELYEMRATNMDTIIVEPCFVESSVDIAIYKSVGPEGIANAIASAVLGNSSLIVKAGTWKQDKSGWYYVYSDDSYAKGVVKIDGKTYVFSDAGYMLIGWQQFDSKYYYLYSDGQAATGWVRIDNIWYYFKTSGEMATGWVQDANKWYYLKSNGAMTTGWINDNGTWYYLYSSGEMATGWKQDNNKWYYLSSTGAMKTGWIQASNTWYYCDSTGAMLTGWQTIDKMQYYFYSNGSMAIDKDNLYGYKIDSKGVCTKI